MLGFISGKFQKSSVRSCEGSDRILEGRTYFQDRCTENEIWNLFFGMMAALNQITETNL